MMYKVSSAVSATSLYMILRYMSVKHPYRSSMLSCNFSASAQHFLDPVTAKIALSFLIPYVGIAAFCCDMDAADDNPIPTELVERW